jgi:type IX secretion system PorP/SprF family membrane protein
MKLRDIIKLGLLVLPVLTTELKAQDPQFTQFYANPLYLNPAFAGNVRCPRICLNYRNQWPNASGTYVTYSASYDQHVDALSGGLGFIVTQDNQARGTLNTTQASLIYSYLLSPSRSFSLKFGLQAGFFQKTLDKTKLNFGDMIDPKRGFVWNTNEQIPSQTKTNLDFSAGVLGYTKQFFFGAAVNHLTQPEEGLQGTAKMPMKITAHAGAMIPLEKGSESSISPNILFQQQQNFTQLNLGVYFTRGAFVGGLWYRNSDAVIILLGIQTDHMKIGYSYDVTVSKLSSNTAGSHEVSLQFQFACKKKRPKYRLMSCPSF